MQKELLMKLALYAARLLEAYGILIWVRIIVSWFSRNPQRNSFSYYLGRIVDPYLNAFRSRRAIVGMLDFSPVLAIGVLYTVESLLSLFGQLGKITLGMVLYVFINAFWQYGLSIYFMILAIALVFKTIASFSRSGRAGAFDGMAAASNPAIDFVKSFSRRKPMSDKTASVISLVGVLVIWFVARYLVQYLASLCLRLPF